MIEKGKLYKYTGDGWLLLRGEDGTAIDKINKGDVFFVLNQEYRITGQYQFLHVLAVKGENIGKCAFSEYLSQFVKEFK